MKRAIFLLLALAACGTPQEQCISRATQDLRIVDQLIAETQANLSRGFAYEASTTYTYDWVICGYERPHKGDKHPRPQMCWERHPRTVREPAAIDVSAEQRKLADLVTKRKQLAQAAKPGIEACKTVYPE